MIIQEGVAWMVSRVDRLIENWVLPFKKIPRIYYNYNIVANLVIYHCLLLCNIIIITGNFCQGGIFAKCSTILRELI